MKANDICTIDKAALRHEIVSSTGKVLEFSNGCSLDLEESGGVFWGTNPYGLDWACNTDENAVDTILRWLAFWDEPRDETGNRVTVIYR